MLAAKDIFSEQAHHRDDVGQAPACQAHRVTHVRRNRPGTRNGRGPHRLFAESGAGRARREALHGYEVFAFGAGAAWGTYFTVVAPSPFFTSW
jgi:hypothetical protein